MKKAYYVGQQMEYVAFSLFAIAGFFISSWFMMVLLVMLVWSMVDMGRIYRREVSE